MAVFQLRRTAVTLAADTGTASFLIMLAATNRALRVVEFSASGLGTASAANELWTTPGNAGTGALSGSITPFAAQPFSTAAAGFTAGTGQATAIPTTSAPGGVAFGVNSNGGTYRWLAKTNFELWAAQAVSGYQSMNVKCVSGTGTISFSSQIEEL